MKDFMLKFLYIFLFILFSPVIIVFSGLLRTINLFSTLYVGYISEKAKEYRKELKPKDYPAYYGWYNHVNIPPEEFEHMMEYRREVVLPSLEKFLSAFLSPKYSIKTHYDCPHYDEIQITEVEDPDGYLVGSIYIRGASHLIQSDFSNSGPKVLCPKCNKPVRIEYLGRRYLHKCDVNEDS